MAVRISLTGALTLRNDAASVGEDALGGRQARLLLARLALDAGRPVPHATLAQLLWGDALPSSWQPALRGVGSRVRGALAAVGLPPAQTLTSTNGCYALRLPPGSVVDVTSADAAIDAAERMLSAD